MTALFARPARLSSSLPRTGAFSLSLLFSLGVLGVSSSAWAQGELPGVAPLGSTGGPPPSSSPSGEEPPETHAASGGTESTLPEGNEPSIPEEPLTISKEVAAQIGTDGEEDNQGTDGQKAKRRYYGLYYHEEAEEYRYRVLFPLWAERKQPSLEDPAIEDRASLYGGLYYNRRAAGARDDVLFPVFWNLENPLEKSRTTVAGPFVNRRTPTESDDWLLPLYMTGTRPDGGYTIIPPLLTMTQRDQEGGFHLIGPAFCSWSGGPACDTRTAQDINLGIAPFYFFGQNQQRLYETIPPLLHYYKYNERTREWVNIYGPYYRAHTEKRELFHVIPFYWSIWGEKERHTTVAPFFHYGGNEKENLLFTPFFLNKNHEDGAHTFITWGYARHRGSTELDMITPLYWNYRDPRIGLDRKLVFPFLYTNTSPREQTTAFFPFWAYQERYGVSSSLWLTPFFNYQTHLRGWSTKVLPFFYFGKDGHARHHVAAPIFWDFKNHLSRTTIVAPLFVRHTNADTVSQVVGNVYYHHRRYKNGLDWQIHLLPLFSYGETPDGHWWNVLFGLTGYTRAGTQSTVRALWVPIELSR